MWESGKVFRQSGYQDLDNDNILPQSSSSRGRTSSLLVTLVGVLGLASILGVSAMTYRSLFTSQETVVIIPVLNVEEVEEMKMVPVLDITSGRGWGRKVPHVGGLPPPDTPDPKWDPQPSESELGLFDYAAVSVDSIPCAKIGKYGNQMRDYDNTTMNRFKRMFTGT